MNRKKLRQLAKQINYGKEITIVFTFAPADQFCFLSNSNTLEISSFYHLLDPLRIQVYLIHEIGHMQYYIEKPSIFVSDYTAEYEANRWSLYRLDELKWSAVQTEYEKYLYEISRMEIEEELDEEYQEAATDLLLELELA